jgi:hypothetical protein
MPEVMTECECGQMAPLTTTDLAAALAASPRFTSTASGYFDELAAAYGADFAGLAWFQACLKLDQDARRVSGCER